MKKFKFVFKFIRNIVSGLIVQGILSLAIGVLIFIYPELLNYLVATLLIASGIIAIALAIKVNKYSKIEIDW